MFLNYAIYDIQVLDLSLSGSKACNEEMQMNEQPNPIKNTRAGERKRKKGIREKKIKIFTKNLLNTNLLNRKLSYLVILH